MARKTKPIGADVGAYIRARMAADSALRAGVRDEFDKLEIARMVRKLREGHHLNQAELAERVGTKQPAIARLESGKAIPRFDLLHKIAQAMGRRLDIRFVPEPSPRRTRLRRAAKQ